MNNNRLVIFISSVFVLLVFSLLVPLSFMNSDVVGSTINKTVITVTVWNTEPDLAKVEITPLTIDLTPGTFTLVNCTGYASDWNGYQDIRVSDAVLYSIVASYGDSDDNNNHYTADLDNNCSCSQDGSNASNATCVCTFAVWYYASNGTWTCNMSITDLGGNATERITNLSSTGSGSATINELVGIYTPDEMDFGNLSVTETSTTKGLNVSNYGNVRINVSVRGYGGTSDGSNPTNSSLICSYGAIKVNYTKYSLASAPAYAAMTSLSNTSTYMNLLIPFRTEDAQVGNDTNTTFWKLKVPLNTGGACNGTLLFTAGQQ